MVLIIIKSKNKLCYYCGYPLKMGSIRFRSRRTHNTYTFDRHFMNVNFWFNKSFYAVDFTDKLMKFRVYSYLRGNFAAICTEFKDNEYWRDAIYQDISICLVNEPNEEFHNKILKIIEINEVFS